MRNQPDGFIPIGFIGIDKSGDPCIAAASDIEYHKTISMIAALYHDVVEDALKELEERIKSDMKKHKKRAKQ